MQEGVFVPYTPDVGPSLRDLSLNPQWKPFLNAFNTWMEQAQVTEALSDGLYSARVGNTVTVTGKIGSGAKVSCVAPIAEFNYGSVLFSTEGYMENAGDEVSFSVTYVAKE